MALIFFFLGGIAATIVLYRFSQEAKRSISRLKHALRSEGLEWHFINDFKFRKKLFLKPSSLIDPRDSVSVMAAKQELHSIQKRFPHVLGLSMLCLLAGLAAAMLSGLLSFD
jgi:hypothetical protein